ncbi:MAG: rRNA pseudouridine synthase [Defluviitaleaceae bacterium]|nr:rRNA pseudouridine synthase [Defluviitaleaceae bacterium]
MEIRLQKYMADCGVASRRHAEAMIEAGRVAVNGQTAIVGAKITPGRDEVCLDGVVVTPAGADYVYILLNKPIGVITSAADQFNRKTVLDLVGDIDARLFPVGRLDYNTSGLILLTNDGDLTNKLTHPRHSVAKTYMAKVDKPLDEADVAAFRKGINIDGRMTLPADLEIISANKKTAKITLREGRNRQIRKMIEALDNNTAALSRIAIGRITLGNLKPGEYRHLSRDEVAYLKGL